MDRLLRELEDVEVGEACGASVSVGVADLAIAVTPEGRAATRFGACTAQLGLRRPRGHANWESIV